MDRAPAMPVVTTRVWAMDLDALTHEVDELLVDADEAAAQPAGAGTDRRPVHTWYVLAGDFHADHVRDSGREAEALVLEHAEEFHQVLGGDDALMGRVLEKLAEDPIEDLRLDFTQWTGDRVVDRAAVSWCAARDSGDLPARAGIRIPALGPDTRQRAVRTLGRFLDGLGEIPPGFVVTVRTVTGAAQVEALLHVVERIEKELAGRIRLEVQLESPSAVLARDGGVEVARVLQAAAGRISGVQLLTEGFGPDRVTDLALALVQSVTHGTEVDVIEGDPCTIRRGDTVVDVWERHLAQVRRALARGLVRGCDTHPSQLPTRYAAAYALEPEDPATGR